VSLPHFSAQFFRGAGTQWAGRAVGLVGQTSISRTSLKLPPLNFEVKMHQIRFRLRFRPIPHWGSLQRSRPQTL